MKFRHTLKEKYIKNRLGNKKKASEVLIIYCFDIKKEINVINFE